MAFVAPLIGAAFGLGAVGTAVVELGLAVGLGYAAKSLRPKSGKRSAAGGQNLSLRIETDAPRQVILGRQATAGTLAYWQCTGADNQILHMVIALADHECEALAEVWVDGKKRAWNSGTGIVSGFSNKLKIRFYRGTSTQTVDTVVRNASGGRWTNDERGIGVCYAVVEAEADEAVFKGGIPQIVFVVDGARLYDPRFDSSVGGSGAQRWADPSTWTHSANNAVAIYNVLRGIYQNGQYLMGLNAPADTIRLSDFEAAANACDEAIALAAGGTEPRYRCGVIVDIGPGLTPEREAIELLTEAMAGDVLCSGGIYRIMAGVSRSIVATLTDEDFIVTDPLIVIPRHSRTDLANAISASHSDPERCYNIVPLPTRGSSIDEAADGGYRWTRALDLSAVRSRTQGQRCQEIRRREARRQLRARGTLRARWFVLEPGDWVAVNSNRRGWSGRTFAIGNSTAAEALTSGREFIDTDAEIDDWTTSDEIADDQVADLPGGGPTMTAISDFTLLNVTVPGVSGQQIPGLRALWTPVTDPTVISIRIEYRKAGDTVVLGEVVQLAASEGQRLWTEGIQGGLAYEARALPVTMPERAVDWTPWASTGTEADQQIVGVAQTANGVAPDTITPEMLDEMSRHLLRLSYAQEAVFGSVNERLSEVHDMIVRLSESQTSDRLAAETNGARIDQVRRIIETEDEKLAEQITTLTATLNGSVATAVNTLTTRVNAVEVTANGKNRVFRQSTTPTALAIGDLWIHTGMNRRLYYATAPGTSGWQVSEDQRIPDLVTSTAAIASSVTQLTTRVEGNEASVFNLAETQNGILARQVLGVDVNGNAAYVDIFGNTYGNGINFVGGEITFSHPSVNGGLPVPVAVIKEVGGVPQFAFTGQFIVNSILSGEAEFATLSAITAKLGDVEAARIRNPANTVIWDGVAMRQYRPDGKMLIDWENPRIRLGSGA